jgi:hypothetical protein
MKAQIPEHNIELSDIAFRGIGSLDRERLEQSRVSKSVLTVRRDESPAHVAERIDESRRSLALIVDEEDRIVGMIVPRWITSQVRRFTTETPANTTEAVAALERMGMHGEKFSHEWLNEARPLLYWCEGEGGHYGDRCPCTDHPAGPCRPDL